MVKTSGSIDPLKLIDLLNNHEKIADVVKELNIPRSTLYNYIRRMIMKGYYTRYYTVYLHRLSEPLTTSIIILSQRVYASSLLRKLKPVTIYYSPYPKPTYIIYSDMDCDELEQVLYSSRYADILEIRVCSFIEESLVIREVYSKQSVVLQRDQGVYEKVQDYIDDYIAKIFFKLYNPPLNIYEKTAAIKDIARKYIGINVFRNHFYRHVYNKVVFKRYIYRDTSRYNYTVMYLQCSSLNLAEQLLNKLFNMGILGGIDQANVLSFDPFTAVLHIWIDEENLWDVNMTHEYFNIAKYDFYIVKQVI